MCIRDRALHVHVIDGDYHKVEQAEVFRRKRWNAVGGQLRFASEPEAKLFALREGQRAADVLDVLRRVPF